MVSSCRNDGTITEELRYPFAGTAVQFRQESSGAESYFIVELITRILDTDAETVSFIVRKLAHFTEYLILGIFLALDAQDIAVMRQRETGFAYIWFIPFLTGMLYAATDEFHQSFVPGRSCELRDMMIDSAGVAAGAFILLLMKRR